MIKRTEYDEPLRTKYWFAIRTKPKSELKVYTRLIADNDVEAYLPISGKKTSPIIPGYVFAYHDANAFHRIKFLPGVKDYVRFGEYPSPIPNEQIELVRKVEAKFCEFEIVGESYKTGQSVRIISGSLTGLVGTLVENAGSKYVAMEIAHLGKTILVRISLKNIIAI